MTNLHEIVYEEAADWVVRLNDAATTEAEFAAWQSWLAEDERHAHAFQEIQDTWRRSASMSSVPLAPIAEEMQEVAPRGERLPRVGVRGVSFVRAISIAASVAVIAAGIVVWRSGLSTVETATAELRSVRLPDGSRASLGPETRFEIDYSADERMLKMRSGEAFFEVTRESGRPFSVVTPVGRVTALGTAFTVNATGDRLAVSVTEGSVRVDPEGVVVAAGNRLVRDKTRTTVKPVSSLAEAVAWQQGRLEYQGEALSVVIADINRYSSVKVHLDDAALGGLRYTGTVFPDTLDVWLKSLEGVFPLAVRSTAQEHRLKAVPLD